MNVFTVLFAILAIGTLWFTYKVYFTDDKDTYIYNKHLYITQQSTPPQHNNSIDSGLEALDSGHELIRSEPDSEECQRYTKLINLRDIKQSDDNIFFVETSCGTKELLQKYVNSREIHMNARQCCAVESAALTNTNHEVYILHTCPLSLSMFTQSPNYIKQMFALPNIFIVAFNLEELIRESPVEGLYHSNKINSSLYPVEHMSDVLRLLALWKFGGTYMDSDTITIKSLNDLKYNYAGWQDRKTVASGVLNLKHDGIGHDILTECLKEINATYNGTIWASNGPRLITRVLVRKCKFQKVEQLAKEKCDILKLYPKEYFYPIYYSKYRDLFKEIATKNLSKMFKNTYSVHFWNKMSIRSVIEVGSNQIYGLLAEKYCPNVYKNCGKYF